MSSLGAPTILLVDDEREILAALRAGLQRGIPHARILTAGNGTDGLKVLESEAVDVIISDQKMPHMEGVEFLTRSRSVAPAAARMMLTAYPDEKLLERNVNEAHIRHFFKKPYTLADVVTVVRLTLEERRASAADALAYARAIEDARRPPPPVGPKAVRAVKFDLG